MNITDCLTILNKRTNKISSHNQQSGEDTKSEGNHNINEDDSACPCVSDPNRPRIDFCQVCQPEQYKIDENIEAASLNALSNLRLIELIAIIQTKRIIAYRQYHDTFEELHETSQIQNYPELCSHMTQIFNQLSQSILAVREELTRRVDAASMPSSVMKQLLNKIILTITELQKHEKEKLLLNASIHLHRMQEYLPSIQSVTGGKNERHENYYKQKHLELAQQINEAQEELLAHKIDLLELLDPTG